MQSFFHTQKTPVRIRFEDLRRGYSDKTDTRQSKGKTGATTACLTKASMNRNFLVIQNKRKIFADTRFYEQRKKTYSLSGGNFNVRHHRIAIYIYQGECAGLRRQYPPVSCHTFLHCPSSLSVSLRKAAHEGIFSPGRGTAQSDTAFF